MGNQKETRRKPFVGGALKKRHTHIDTANNTHGMVKGQAQSQVATFVREKALRNLAIFEVSCTIYQGNPPFCRPIRLCVQVGLPILGFLFYRPVQTLCPSSVSLNLAATWTKCLLGRKHLDEEQRPAKWQELHFVEGELCLEALCQLPKRMVCPVWWSSGVAFHVPTRAKASNPNPNQSKASRRRPTVSGSCKGQPKGCQRNPCLGPRAPC